MAELRRVKLNLSPAEARLILEGIERIRQEPGTTFDTKVRIASLTTKVQRLVARAGWKGVERG